MLNNASEAHREITYQEYLNRENSMQHPDYQEEMLQYEYLKMGDPRAIAENQRMFSNPALGKLSNDPLTNKKYLFVASTTLATRFAIEGGMEPETAYSTSDYYIQQLDRLSSVEDVIALQTEMIRYFTQQVALAGKAKVYSRPVLQCMDYIYDHLYEKITAEQLARQVDRNPKYLSTLFRQETGHTIQEYVLERRIEAAKNMLKYSDYSYAEISSTLSFASQSYFIRQFKRRVGMTPKEFRDYTFRSSF